LTQWVAIVPYFLYGVLWVFAPGLIVGAVARLRGFGAVAVAPAVSTGIVGVAAVLGGLVRVPWGPLPVLLVTILTAAVVLLARRLTGRQPSAAKARADLRNRAAAWGQVWFSREWRWWVGFVVAAGLVGWNCVHILGKPTAFSQANDELFHLNGVRWILDHADGSSLFLNSMVGSGGFYPAAWHDLVSLTAQPWLAAGNAAAVVLATNAVMVIAAAVIWPLGVLALLQVVVGRRAVVFAVAFVAILIGSTADGPYRMMSQQYPLLLSTALFAALLALIVTVFRLHADRDAGESEFPSRLVSAILIVVGLAGITLAHPSSLLALAGMVTLPMGVTMCVRYVRRGGLPPKKAVLAWGGLALAFVATVGLWVALRTGTSVQSEPKFDALEAARRFWLACAFIGVPLWPFAVLFIVGLIVALWQRTQLWLVGALVWTGLLWGVAAVSDGTWSYWLVSGFYSLYARITPYVVDLQLVFAGIALAAISAKAVELATKKGWAPRARIPVIAVLVVLLVGMTVVGRTGESLTQRVSQTVARYKLTAKSPFVDRDEYALITQLPALVDNGKVVAVDAWGGGAFAYALTGVPVSAYSLQYKPSSALEVVESRLNRAAGDPAVCAAVRELRIGYVLDFGAKRISAFRKDLPGFSDMAEAPGFVPVASRGHAVLYRVDACS